MAASASLVPYAVQPFNAFATGAMKRISVQRCQVSGKTLADRSLSQLLKQDWPKCIDDL